VQAAELARRAAARPLVLVLAAAAGAVALGAVAARASCARADYAHLVARHLGVTREGLYNSVPTRVGDFGEGWIPQGG